MSGARLSDGGESRYLVSGLGATMTGLEPGFENRGRSSRELGAGPHTVGTAPIERRKID